MEIVWLIGGALIGVSLTLGWCWWRGYAHLRDGERRRAEARAQCEAIIAQARREAENLLREADLRAKDELLQKRSEFNREVEQARQEWRQQERRLEQREDELNERRRALAKKQHALMIRRRRLKRQQEQFETRQRELETLLEQQRQRLEEISGMSREQAERLLMDRLERDLTDRLAARLQRHEEEYRATAEQKAREILASAIQRVAASHTADTTVSTVDIPTDDMKGRIIGREGRNIRTFEKATGVDVIVDDTPGVVVVSAFDNIRREVARLSLVKLIADGRIHPTRIEEVVKETQDEIERHILTVGEQAAQEANVGPLHEKLYQLLGRLKFRTSYSQNVLQHSLEVAHLCGLMAEELRLDGRLARRCGLLHDIGKAADHDMEGGHPKGGAELARRYGETDPRVLHAIAGHHDDITLDHIYTVLVAAADTISAARPGARRETLEKYVKRLEELEALALSFPGVEQAYAIQAGREVRVIADSQRLNDAEAVKVCHDIARAIEEKMMFPGEIKVTVVREVRATEIAR
ncbi:MAG: ribonuclease Y [Gemmataceae bacterium]|nr:ribonuclease Y [Gemmataceae bacterium]